MGGLVLMFQQTSNGICFSVVVIPKSSRNEIVEWKNDELKIRLAAVPEKGKANEELIRYLAEVLNIGKTHVNLVRGEASRRKKVSVKGMSMEEIENKIQDHLSKRAKKGK